jgi:hypothetical protein
MMNMYKSTELVKYYPESFQGWKLVGTPQYAESVYKVGVIEPIILAKYRNKVSLVAGNRRILSYLSAVERAIDDGTFDDRPWLHSIDAKIYHGLNPDDQVAISQIENEERSENIVLAYRQMKQLESEGKWEQVAEMINLNHSRERRLHKLNNIDPVFLDAHVEEKIAKGTLLRIASLTPARQAILKQTLEKKGKLTMPDIRDAKSAQVDAAVRKMPALPAMPVPQVEQEPAMVWYLLGSPNGDNAPKVDGIFNSLTVAIANRDDNQKIYRLVEV